MTSPLWQPDTAQIESSNMSAFMRHVETTHGFALGGYEELYHWSVNQSEDFWNTFWDFAGVLASTRGAGVLEYPTRMPGARWFPEARLNFAENLLRFRGDQTALSFNGENRVHRSLSRDELHAQVSMMAQALRQAGVQPGDRIAAYLPNMPEAIIAMLASSSIGAIFSSCSPDFGLRGVLDRFGQIEPKVLFIADGYYYNGKWFDSLDTGRHLLEQLPSVTQVVVAHYSGADEGKAESIPTAKSWQGMIRNLLAQDIEFEQLPFDHPLYIMYSSGTTGAPKCIVHGAGGTLLQHLKEHRLHVNLKERDRFFYFTTCGWMMWNWLASGLASGAELLLYDGSPFHPDGNTLFEFAQRSGMNIFGTSAKFIDALGKAGLEPGRTHDLCELRTMLSTGSPLAPEGFDYVYQHIKQDLCLSSIAGGTDIVSCFALGNPNLPVWRGELQCRGLGMKVEVFNEDGHPVTEQRGELVCSAPFPCMPVGFWNDPDGGRYHAAYFEHFPNVWYHGDFVELTNHHGMIFYGRSDATLNPGGVRIGTAEIYRQVEQVDEVLESLVIGQDWQGDVRVVLFVRLREGVSLDEALQDTIRKQVRRNTTPRHVPAKIIAVDDIPRTKSGKIVELAVRNVVHGWPIKNREALANPEALELYKDLPELAC
ncbi:MAG: acetoacetate--CoA ligase [Gammaproteobacteria bacterium]|nr:acetoacetate--CoA ligase [Gammaproteobacteria bacterium]